MDEFYQNKAQRDGIAPYCVACEKKYLVERRERDSEGERKRSMKYRLKCVFGITPEEYKEMEDIQDGVCAICSKPPTTQRLHVDHDHNTGLIRGLLCYSCNRTLIGRETNPAKFDLAAHYLRQPPAHRVLGKREVPKKKRKSRAKRGK